MTPFKLLIGSNMRLKDDPALRAALEEELLDHFQQARSELRDEAKANIAKIQEENKRSFNKRQKKASDYVVDDVVAIRRTQGGPV